MNLNKCKNKSSFKFLNLRKLKMSVQILSVKIIILYFKMVFYYQWVNKYWGTFKTFWEISSYLENTQYEVQFARLKVNL